VFAFVVFDLVFGWKNVSKMTYFVPGGT